MVTGKVLFAKDHNLQALCQTLDCHVSDLLVEKKDRLVDYLLEGELLDKLSPYGDYQMVEKIFESILVESMDKQTKGEVYLILANTNWRRKAYDKALDYCDKALNIGTSMNNKNMIFESLFQIGTIYSILSQIKALDYMTMSYDLKAYAKHSKKIASLCNNLSMTYREMGYLDKANSIFKDLHYNKRISKKNK